jgi:hypothetical protein
VLAVAVLAGVVVVSRRLEHPVSDVGAARESADDQG